MHKAPELLALPVQSERQERFFRGDSLGAVKGDGGRGFVSHPVGLGLYFGGSGKPDPSSYFRKIALVPVQKLALDRDEERRQDSLERLLWQPKRAGQSLWGGKETRWGRGMG